MQKKTPILLTKMVAGILVVSFMLAACGGASKEEQKGEDVKNTTVNSESQSSIGNEKVTDVVSKPQEIKIEGFYNSINGLEPFVRVDLEIKETHDGYKALFYAQYTSVDIYESEQILQCDKVDGNTYTFSGEDEEYTVVWDGKDGLKVTGTSFNGDYKRGMRDDYGEPEYQIADIAHYEVDKNVEEGIEIDSTLAAAVRKALQYEAGEKLTLSDLESVTYLESFREPITSLKGVSLLKNLEEIHIGEGFITNMDELAKLSNIRFIEISNCYIEKIPNFSKCSELESLYLSCNMIKDASPIAKATSLKYVDLNGNFIKSIEPLKEVNFLQSLNIEANCILDYDSIEGYLGIIGAYDSGSQGTYEEALALENKAKKIAEAIPDGLSEVEIEAWVYRYIIDNMYYDEAGGATKAYGYYGIMEGRGVCGDYAEAFSLIANHAGLDVIVCSSEDHAWNIVKIDGIYYHADALWDDDNDDETEWIHFNRSTGVMYNLESHMHDLRRYPICDYSMSILEYDDFMEN